MKTPPMPPQRPRPSGGRGVMLEWHGDEIRAREAIGRGERKEAVAAGDNVLVRLEMEFGDVGGPNGDKPLHAPEDWIDFNPEDLNFDDDFGVMEGTMREENASFC